MTALDPVDPLNVRVSAAHGLESIGVDQRAHQGVRIARIADRNLGDERAQPADQSVGDAVVDDEAPEAGAALPGSAGCAEQDRAFRKREVGRGGNDHRIIAAKFEQGPTEARRHLWPEFASHAGRSGGRDQGYAGIVGQRCADIAAALDELQQPLGRIAKAGQGSPGQSHHRGGGQRRLLAGFPDQRVAAH